MTAIYLLCMALVTYFIRMIPLTAFRKKIKSRFLKSFFQYIPYAVLGAMTVPWILYSTADLWSALAGSVCIFILAYLDCSLTVVAIAGCGVAFAVSLIMSLC